MGRRVALTVLGVLLATAGPAEAGYRVGLSEQRPEMFASPAWQALGLKLVRYLVPWDWQRDGGERAEVAAFMDTARARGQDVLVTFTAHRGCFDGLRYSRSPACRAPGRRAYRAAVRAFDDRYPWVRTYSAWNEINHVSQPTFTNPRLAARYYDVLRRESRRRHFRVMAADLLDTSNMRGYLRSFLRSAPGRPRLWGLHNYQDVNRLTAGDTRELLETVPGEVWLTETGAIVRLGAQFPYSEARAASRTRWLFFLAGHFGVQRRGVRARLGRVYVYKWFGEPPGARFDAGLVNLDGSPRAGLAVFGAFARPRP